MAKHHAHRDRDPGRVTLDHYVPDALLTGADLAPVREAYAAYLTAQGAVSDAHERLESAKEAKANRAAEIQAAVLAGKKVPAAISEEEAEAMEKAAASGLASALRDAFAAATAYERALTTHRSAARKALIPAFRRASEQAAAARQAAELAEGKRDAILSALNGIDMAAAEAEQAASGEPRGSRMTGAVHAARRRLGRYAATEADLLTSEEYVLAARGTAIVEAARELREKLATARDAQHLSATEKAVRIAKLEEALRKLLPNRPNL